MRRRQGGNEYIYTTRNRMWKIEKQTWDRAHGVLVWILSGVKGPSRNTKDVPLSSCCCTQKQHHAAAIASMASNSYFWVKRIRVQNTNVQFKRWDPTWKYSKTFKIVRGVIAHKPNIQYNTVFDTSPDISEELVLSLIVICQKKGPKTLNSKNCWELFLQIF